MSDLEDMCHIDKGTYTDGPVRTADVRRLLERIAELEAHITTDNTAVILALEKRVEELSAEIAEQARLLDMSASREAKLLARIKELENGI